MEEPKKVLFIATVEIHIRTFHLPYLKYFRERGYEVHVACAGRGEIPHCHVRHTIPFERSPFKPGNLQAFFALKALMAQNRYALVHCHTPVGGVIGRLAAMGARKKGTRVCYTAHGFQFYRGGPLKDWMLYYPVERFLSRFTDMLITINQEDYETALRKRFKAGTIQKVNGVGLEIEKFQGVCAEEAAAIRAALGVSPEEVLLLCVGEINRNKNQGFLLELLKDLKADSSGTGPFKLALAGPDSLDGALEKKAAALGLLGDVIFLGYRRDIPALLSAADMAVSASLREGLPFNVLEAMAAGRPVVVTDIRGHRDLVRHGVNGLLVKPGDRAAFAAAVRRLCGDKALRLSLGRAGASAAEGYGLGPVMARMQSLCDTFEAKS